MKKNLTIVTLSLILSILFSANIAAQYIRVQVVPNHNDWLYKPGENAKFTVNILRNEIPVKDAEIRYEISEDTMEPRKKESMILKDGTTTIDAGTMKNAGFLRCRVWVKYDGNEYNSLATAGYNPQDIKPYTKLPDDFIQFWDSAKAEARKLPLDSRIVLDAEKCTDKVNVYNVNFQNVNNSRIYGVLCVPKAPGKYPAILTVPGAGVREYKGDIATAEKGVITLEIGIHGIPVNLDKGVYTDLSKGALNGYFYANLDNKDTYYYKRVYVGCVRAVDFLYSLPEFDGKNLGVRGASQGGALAIITGALDNRVKSIISVFPALCDLTAYQHGRAGGWPHMFKDGKNDTPSKLETASYYDVVNFARQINVPVYYTLGYNDIICPPSSMYAALNSINSPKTFQIIEHIGHYTYPEEQINKAINWMLKTLNTDTIK